MNCLPVIEMEMRSASRRNWTFWLRILFALAGFGTCMAVLIAGGSNPTRQGQTMLAILSYISLAFCLFSGCLMTADCVSMEKREGTLGLLLLTPLSGMDIVLGKMIFHTLQLGFGVCALFPVFFLPLLAGGVTWAEVSRIVLALGLSLLLSAAVGMLVSVMGSESRKTVMTSFSSVFLIAVAPMAYMLFQQLFFPTRFPGIGFPQLSPVFAVMGGFESYYSMPGRPVLYWFSQLALLGVSLIAIWVSGFMLVSVFKTSSQGKTAGRRRQVLPATTQKPLAPEQNPYEWVVLRGAGNPFSVTTYFLLVLFVAMLGVSLCTAYWQAGFCGAFFTALALHWIFKLWFAVESAKQIHSDRLSGALELVLVSPLPEKDVGDGHRSALRHIARRPLFVLIGLNTILILCVHVFPDQLHMDQHTAMIFDTFFMGGIVVCLADFYALPWLALFHGIRASTHVKAALGAFCALMLVPWIGFGLVVLLLISSRASQYEFVTMVIVYYAFCLLYTLLAVARGRQCLAAGIRRLVSTP